MVASEGGESEAFVAEAGADDHPAKAPAGTLRRALRLSYAQAMLGAIYGASTGGMFLIGYALKLGATDVQIGLMSTIPMLCVLAQLPTSALVETGLSRRRLTFAASCLNVLGWGLVIAIPFVAPQGDAAQGDAAQADHAGNPSPHDGSLRVGLLIGLVAFITLCAHVAGNARSSWIGDLVPATIRSSFFGRLARWSGVVATGFALLEGSFLDHVKHMGIGAFTTLFAFGMIFGLINAWLFLPQADVPLKHHEREGFLAHAAGAFRNRPLWLLVAYGMLLSLQTVAAPFFVTYMLRDLGMSFVGVGLFNAVLALSILVFAPWWGRITQRHGCRPVLVACTWGLAPLPFVWMWIDSPGRVYLLALPVQVLAGFFASGINLASSTLIYKVTPRVGRSVQFAIYSAVVVVAAAPMPTLGGCLPGWLESIGIHAGLRATFYCVAPCMAAAAIAASFLKEEGVSPTGAMVRGLLGRFGRVRPEVG
ncbi:MAG: MFS transporter [Planctomycetota bacterium]|nr:MFS transporter [Planctomycetota bacterium]